MVWIRASDTGRVGATFGTVGMNDHTDWVLRLGYLIHDVSRLRRMMFDRTLAPLGITRSQWWVLAFVSRKNGLPQTQLASELDVGKVALGALIDRLESAGFVFRQNDPNDRRVKRVYLTKQSMDFLKRIRKETDKFNAYLVEGIGRAELETTSETLFAMKRRLLGMSEGSGLTNGRDDDETPTKAKARKPMKSRKGVGQRLPQPKTVHDAS
jgi:DNA-binding MarR family transcriptional regulator